MGFITAILLNYMEEESVFWMLHSIMENNKYNMKGHFINGMPDLNKSFYKLIVLIKRYLPKIYDLFVFKVIKILEKGKGKPKHVCKSMVSYDFYN